MNRPPRKKIAQIEEKTYPGPNRDPKEEVVAGEINDPAHLEALQKVFAKQKEDAGNVDGLALERAVAVTEGQKAWADRKRKKNIEQSVEPKKEAA